MLSWLVVGTIVGVLIGVASAYEANRMQNLLGMFMHVDSDDPDLFLSLSFSVWPTFLGFYEVGKMLREYGTCIRIY